ncbi:MAG: acetate--CoA ligase family protein, partial [Actinomycetes bacterium]
AVSAYAHWRQRDPGAVPLLEVDELAAGRIVNRVLSQERRGRELTETETAELLGAYGVRVVPRFPVSSLEDANRVASSLGWNVVLKSTADELRGRPDLASVHRNINDPDEMEDAWEDLGLLVSELGLGSRTDQVVSAPVVQVMAPAGVALQIGSREDAAFGPMVSLGLDGIASELLGDMVYRVPPLTTGDAAVMVRDLKAAPMLFGRHGSPGVDVEAVQDLIHRVAQLADDHPQLAEVSLRPCIASPAGISVLGARVMIAPTGAHRDALARMV